LSNTALKAVVSVALGNGGFRWRAASGLAVIGLALAVSILFLSARQ
jgi:hypothetical protein